MRVQNLGLLHGLKVQEADEKAVEDALVEEMEKALLGGPEAVVAQALRERLRAFIGQGGDASKAKEVMKEFLEEALPHAGPIQVRAELDDKDQSLVNFKIEAPVLYDIKFHYNLRF